MEAEPVGLPVHGGQEPSPGAGAPEGDTACRSNRPAKQSELGTKTKATVAGQRKKILLECHLCSFKDKVMSDSGLTKTAWHTSWSLRMDPTWLSSLPRVLGPPGPGSCSPTVRSRGAPEGRTGRPRHQHPRRPSQRRPSPARLFPVSPGTPSPCHWSRPLGGPSSARPKGPPLPAGLPRSRFGLWFWEGALKLPVTVSHPRPTVPPRPAPRPWGGGTGAVLTPVFQAFP